MRIVVTGPESSGTRLMARILETTEADVLHRTMPYKWDPHWPTEDDFGGFQPDVLLVMLRDEEITARSQLRRGHVPSLRHAFENVDAGLRRLARWAAVHGVMCLFVSYEKLVADPRSALTFLSSRLGIGYPNSSEAIVDGNAKYVGELF